MYDKKEITKGVAVGSDSDMLIVKIFPCIYRTRIKRLYFISTVNFVYLFGDWRRPLFR